MSQTRRRRIRPSEYALKVGFFIGNSPISIEGYEITVGNNTYKGTPGLWKLMTRKKPDETIYSQNDLDEYEEILNSTGAMYRPYAEKS